MVPSMRALVLLALAGIASSGSLKDIKHVVIFMQENRSYNSYFGTMAGARGFNDPNVPIDPETNTTLFAQPVNVNQSDVPTLLPWYLGYLGGNTTDAIQCMSAGSNAYEENQAALNHDKNDQWVTLNTPYSWGYYTRNELPVQFGIAEGWTVGDMYQESSITATCPNRVTLVSGSINVPGGPQHLGQGGVYLDNNETPGCEGDNLNCYPMKWKTIYEFYEEAGVSWQVYQNTNNFDDNSLGYFEQFQKAPKNSPLAQKGMAFIGLDRFYQDCKDGTLPQVSFVVGPMELSEHPPYMPKDGAWLQQQVVNAVVNGKDYNSTALLISYDETGGFGDHVTPYHSPKGTPGEWLEDPYGKFGDIYSGPGFRLPFYIISPWTRGGHVYTARTDHNSQILFVEKWLAALGKNVTTDQMVPWRRYNMDDLVGAFDFDHPDYSIPNIPQAEEPSTDSKGNYDGASKCESTYAHPQPPVPWHSQTENFPESIMEKGWKDLSGQLTEGRYLVFALPGLSSVLSFGNKGNTTKLGTSSIKSKRGLESRESINERGSVESLFSYHLSPSERSVSSLSSLEPLFKDKSNHFVVHYNTSSPLTTASNTFLISNPSRTLWFGPNDSLVGGRDEAAPIDIIFLPGGDGQDRGYVLLYHDTASTDSNGKPQGKAVKGVKGVWGIVSATY